LSRGFFLRECAEFQEPPNGSGTLYTGEKDKYPREEIKL
jgi:hypothetical protein